MTVPKLRFKAFDGAWTFSKIGEIFKVTSGSTPLRSDNRFFENAHIPWVKTTDLNDSFIYETEEKISEIALKETSVKILPKGTVFVAMYGGFNQIGRTGLLLNESACNQALSAIYPHEKIDSFFLLTYLNHKVDDWKNFAASSRKDPNITKSDVLAFPFVYPSKTEQTKIASFLSAVDEKISQLNKKHELLSQYKQGMMQKLFSQQIRFKADDGSEFGEWEDKKIGDIFKVTSGSTPLRSDERYFKNAEIFWVKTTDLNNGLITKTEEKISKVALEETSIKVLPKGTVFVAMYGGFNQIGRTGLLTMESACNQALSAIYPNQLVNPYFLLTYLNFKVEDWKSFAASSRKDPNITKSDVLAFPFILMSLEEQTKIAHFLSAIDQKIEVVAQKIKQAKMWKKGLLQQMFI